VAARRRDLSGRRGDGGGAPLPHRAHIRACLRRWADIADPQASPIVRVCVVAEYYPRRRDPVLGVWAHRQALAARDAGADVKVLVLERPVPPAAALRRPWRLLRALAGIARQPAREELDGIEVRYVRFTAGQREKTYATWHERA